MKNMQIISLIIAMAIISTETFLLDVFKLMKEGRLSQSLPFKSLVKGAIVASVLFLVSTWSFDVLGNNKTYAFLVVILALMTTALVKKWPR